MDKILLMLRDVNMISVAVRIALSVIIGGLIGLERGMKNRPAGLRTYMVVCLGACLIMLTNHFVYQQYSTGDPVRMGAQVVSGIGFLGAGTIIVTRRNQIKGLTTAAGLWACAGVGLALGIGFYEAALLGGFGVFFVMTMMQKLDNRMRHSTKVIEIYVELGEGCPLGDFLRQIRERDIEIKEMMHEHDSDSEDGTRAYIATLKLQQRQKHAEVIEDIRTIPGVAYLEEL